VLLLERGGGEEERAHGGAAERDGDGGIGVVPALQLGDDAGGVEREGADAAVQGRGAHHVILIERHRDSSQKVPRPECSAAALKFGVSIQNCTGEVPRSLCDQKG
jgi:hypothetical protein